MTELSNKTASYLKALCNHHVIMSTQFPIQSAAVLHVSKVGIKSGIALSCDNIYCPVKTVFSPFTDLFLTCTVKQKVK